LKKAQNCLRDCSNYRFVVTKIFIVTTRNYLIYRK